MTTIPFLLYLKGNSLKKRLLFYFFTYPSKEHYLRELALILGGDPGNVSRELRAFGREGIFRSRKRGNQKFFSLNPDYPLYRELEAIVRKTAPAELTKETPRTATVYLLAGANGAGKTTLAKKILPDYLGVKTFINADLIAGGIAPFDAEGVALKAGKLLLTEIEDATKKQVDFGFETTLSGKSYVNLIRKLVAAGFAVHVLFLWIPTVALALKRVEERVRRGGHHIPTDVVKRRFHRGIYNLFHLYAPIISSWTILDNSGERPKLIAYSESGHESILDHKTFQAIKKTAGIPSYEKA